MRGDGHFQSCADSTTIEERSAEALGPLDDLADQGDDGRVGTVTFESANAKGTSKVVLVGQEEIVDDYRVGEFYELTLNQVQAPK